LRLSEPVECIRVRGSVLANIIFVSNEDIIEGSSIILIRVCAINEGTPVVHGGIESSHGSNKRTIDCVCSCAANDCGVVLVNVIRGYPCAQPRSLVWVVYSADREVDRGNEKRKTAVVVEPVVPSPVTIFPSSDVSTVISKTNQKHGTVSSNGTRIIVKSSLDVGTPVSKCQRYKAKRLVVATNKTVARSSAQIKDISRF